MLRIELVWLLVTACSIAGLSWLGGYLWFFALVPMVVCALIGLILLAARISQVRSPELRRASGLRASVLGASMIALVVGFPALQRAGSSLHVELRFRAQRADLDLAVLLELTGHGDAELQKRLGYRRDDGPPLRLAFPAPGGVLDNWCGTVFDMTGSVMRINEFRADSAQSNLTRSDEPTGTSLSKLFGGDMIGCRKLHAPYYFCCFT
jgi:hypothetical protein